MSDATRSWISAASSTPCKAGPQPVSVDCESIASASSRSARPQRGRSEGASCVHCRSRPAGPPAQSLHPSNVSPLARTADKAASLRTVNDPSAYPSRISDVFEEEGVLLDTRYPKGCASGQTLPNSQKSHAYSARLRSAGSQVSYHRGSRATRRTSSDTDDELVVPQLERCLLQMRRLLVEVYVELRLVLLPVRVFVRANDAGRDRWSRGHLQAEYIKTIS